MCIYDDDTWPCRISKAVGLHRRPVKFAVGDQVMLATQHLKLLGEARRTRKFTERYLGPYRVKKVVNDNAYELELPARWRIHPVINVSQLKEYHDGTAAFPDRPTPLTRPPPVAVEDNGAPEWEVERILDHRRQGRRKVLQYLVQWKGYPQYEATWEPLEVLDGALDLVIEYNQSKNIDIGVTVELSVAQSSAWSQPLNLGAKTELRGLSSVSQSGGGCDRASVRTSTPISSPDMSSKHARDSTSSCASECVCARAPRGQPSEVSACSG